MADELGSVFQQTEPRLDQRPFSQPFMTTLALYQFKRPVVLPAAADQHEWLTAAALERLLEKQQRVKAGSVG
jgi:hypothetical protein